MASMIGKYAAQKLLKSHMKQYKSKKVEGEDDPFFALVEDPKRPGKFKKVKKQIPAYIPEHDALILAKFKKQAYRLDMCLFELFGVRFGWESVIGLIPFAGDAIGAALAMLLVRKSMKVEGGLPQSILLMMVLNIVMDFAVGLIPFIGDLADAAFKCNTRNVKLLEKHLDKKYNTAVRDERDRVGEDKQKRQKNRKSGIFHPRDPPPATVFEDFSDEEEDRRQFVAEGRAADARVQQPPASAGRDVRRDAELRDLSNAERTERRLADIEAEYVFKLTHAEKVHRHTEEKARDEYVAAMKGEEARQHDVEIMEEKRVKKARDKAEKKKTEEEERRA